MTLLGQTISYLCAGGAVTLLDVALFNLLARGKMNISPVLANAISCTCAMSVGFISHFYFVFQPTEPDFLFRAIKYVLATGSSAYVVQNVVITFLLSVRRQCPVCFHECTGSIFPASNEAVILNVIKICAVGAGMVSNFVLLKFVVYAS